MLSRKTIVCAAVAPDGNPTFGDRSLWNWVSGFGECGFAEALEIVRKAWAPAEFAHQGGFWKVPAADFNGNPFANGIVRVNVTPKPAQLSVPVWIAGGDSAAVERAARLGLT